MRYHFSTLFKTTLGLFLLLFCFQLQAQDTTFVQTITWDNDSRSGTFNFPDGSESYQRVLMYYNMRCKNGDVNTTGGNGVACGEWDYSCNTFITVPNMVDSTRRNHPTHLITNFTNQVGDIFEYTSQPTFTYLQFEQHDITLTAGENVITAQVGNGVLPMPLAADQAVGRAQFLYTAAELTAAGLVAGELDALQLDLSQIGDDIDYMRIRLKATTKTELTTQNPDLEGFTEVYFKNTSFPLTGWNDFNFYQPFAWDGTSNIIVETSFTGTTANNTVNGHDSGLNMALFNAQADNSLFFNGSGGVDLPTDGFSSIENEITISLWCHGTPEIMPVSSTLFQGVDDNNIRQANVHLPWSNSQVYWDCGNDGSNYDRINKTANEADFEGQWNHWAFTKNATTGVMNIFLNGVQWHTGTDKFRPINITDFDLASSITETNGYYGKIDNLRIWDVALDETTIQAWMRRDVDNTHPSYTNLIANYTLDEGTGLMTNDASANAATANINGAPTWSSVRGKDLYKNFISSTLRLNMNFIQGDFTLMDQTIITLDSVANPPSLMTSYGLTGTTLEEIGTEAVYASGDMNILNEAGDVVGTVAVSTENSIEIGQLTHYQKRDAKIELLSLVTPYGIGLDLGDEGKTWVLDVTDFVPLLKDERFISVEMGGQFQEELDIEFAFIHGTPPAEVLSIQNIWPFARGYYGDILADNIFEPRDITLNPNGKSFKLRSSITGHQQNGEFTPRLHYINLNNTPLISYQIWTECSFNPVYPQGGTWTFDRAGWCPGAPTDIHETDISIVVEPGETINLDYTVQTPAISEANYLVSNLLVTYGEPNFENDAAIVDVMRPSNRVEYQRINPACDNPIVVIKNTGSNSLTSLKIDYTVENGLYTRTHEWVGNLNFLESTQVVLPVENVNFYATNNDEKVFVVTVREPNGQTDEYTSNNTMKSRYEFPDMLDPTGDFRILLTTNNRPQENSYTIKDSDGNIVLSRSNLAANTTYEDQIDFPAGCYTIELKDVDTPNNQYGNDGLSYWVFPESGNGSFRIRQFFPQTSLPFRTFDGDFGGGITYDFAVGTISDAPEVDHVRLLSIQPNPAQDATNLDLIGFEGMALNITLTDMTGRILRNETIEHPTDEFTHPISLAGLANGMYYVRIANGERVWVQEIVKQ